MIQEDKELLLKDLSARLPYGVKMNHIADDEHSPKTLIGVAKDMITLEGFGGYECVDIEDYKPYLLPLSSITEEQYNEMQSISGIDCLDHFEVLKSIRECTEFTHWPLYEYRVIDWFNKNHFDYRGLIEKGLAIDATDKNIY